MSKNIPESDWKQFRKVHETLLKCHCQETLEYVQQIASTRSCDPHELYLKIYKFIQKRDKEKSYVFDDFRRSTALMQLIIMRKIRLLTDDDLICFSQETQLRIRTINESIQAADAGRSAGE